MKIALAGLLTLAACAPGQATLIRYELSCVLKSYGADATFPAGSPFLKNTFPLNTPYHATFTVDTARGVIVTNTATSRRYNRDAGLNPVFVTEGSFRLGEAGSPLYEGTFHVGTKGSFSVQMDNTPSGDLLHVELFNDVTTTKFNFTQVFGPDLSNGLHPLGFTLHLPSTDVNALADVNIPQTIDSGKFTYSDQGVRFFFGGFSPNSDWVGGGLGGPPGGGTITATVLPPPLVAWRNTYGDDAAVSSSDGLPNLVKYALGLPANAAALPAQLPQASLAAGGAQQFLRLSVPRGARRSDVTYVVEVSDDMLTWHSGTGHTEIVQDLDTELIVRDTLPTDGTTKRFIRLVVQPIP